jgi:hypothetical protein
MLFVFNEFLLGRKLYKSGGFVNPARLAGAGGIWYFSKKKKYLGEKMKYIWLILSLLALPGLYAGGNAETGTYYVEARGNDKNDGLSRETPFQTLGKAVDMARRNKIKRITVVGILTEASEQKTAFARDPESVFFIKDSGRTEILIRGLNQGELGAAGTGKRVIKIEGRAAIRFEHIGLTGGFRGLETPGNGGGIYAETGSITLGPGAEVEGNRGIQGGGVYAVSARVTLAGGRIGDNFAEGSIGEAGGGLYLRNCVAKIIDGEITGNTAMDDNGGGIFLKDGSLEMTGGTINSNVGGGAYIVSSLFTLKNGTIQDNRVTYNAGGLALFLSDFVMTGGKITDNLADNSGGGLFALQSACAISGGEIARNRAEYGGGLCINATDSDRPLDIAISGGVIHHNQAKETGGGLFILNGTLELTGEAEISGNTALSGGGIGAENSSLAMKGGLIKGNVLSGNGRGGGISVASGALDLQGGEIAENAGLYGGGVSAADSAFTLRGTGGIIGNTAGGSGGGVYVGNGTFEIFGGEIRDNIARNTGGGVYAGGYCNVLISGGAVSGNRSAKEGGGFDIRAYTIVTMTGAVFRGNRAEKGGGLHVGPQGVFNMWNSNLLKPEGGLISGNEAAAGGGVYVAPGGDLSRRGGVLEGNIPEDLIIEENPPAETEEF